MLTGKSISATLPRKKSISTTKPGIADKSIESSQSRLRNRGDCEDFSLYPYPMWLLWFRVIQVDNPSIDTTANN